MRVPLLSSLLRSSVEIFLSHLYSLTPSLIATEVVPQLQVTSARPTLLASLVLILAQATKYIEDEAEVTHRRICDTCARSSHPQLLTCFMSPRLCSLVDFSPPQRLSQARSSILLLQPYTACNFGHVRVSRTRGRPRRKVREWRCE